MGQVLVLNCGSSSVKYTLYDMDRPDRRASGGAPSGRVRDGQSVDASMGMTPLEAPGTDWLPDRRQTLLRHDLLGQRPIHEGFLSPDNADVAAHIARGMETESNGSPAGQ